uniref:CSON009767 protein n=1 Tax=Culicoides sonorensis TaxID=179676 RepID=A0A336LHC8_CULSO
MLSLQAEALGKANTTIKGAQMNIIAIYRPPPLTAMDVNPFLERLEWLFETCGTKQCLLLGDLSLHPENNAIVVKQCLDLLECYNFKLCNNSYNLRRKFKRKPSRKREIKLIELSRMIAKEKINSKNNYYKNLFNNNDQKSTWKNINKILERESQRTKNNFTIDTHHNRLTDNKAVANAFNDYFSNIGAKMAKSISARPYNDINHHNTLFFNYIMREKLKEG